MHFKGTIYLSILFVGCFCHQCKKASNNVKVRDQIVELDSFPALVIPREDITFILGEDHELDNPFYKNATLFYRFDSNSQTDYFVSHCRTLKEVLEYLQAYPPLNNEPWGKINLISHGNQWVGMSLKTHEDGKRVSEESLEIAIQDSILTPIDDSLVDNRTEIFIHACGIGNNKKFLEKFAWAIGGDACKPKIIASKKFEYYTTVLSDNHQPEYRRYLSDYWFIHYKKGYKPSNQSIIKKFEAKYPNTNIEWDFAITNEYPEYPGQPYYYSFEIPVKWVVIYPDSSSIPNVSSKSKQLEWLITQDDLMKALAKMELNIFDFNWWFRQILYKVDENTLKPALWVKGYCTYFCVLRPIVEESDSLQYKAPYIPEINDTNYFCVED